MKNKALKSAVLLTAAAAAVFITGHILAAGEIQPGAIPDSPSAAAESVPYILRSWNGKIAVFTGEFSTAPAIETDIRLESLREYDRRLLDAGISAGTYEEMLKLLEDFSP